MNLAIQSLLQYFSYEAKFESNTVKPVIYGHCFGRPPFMKSSFVQIFRFYVKFSLKMLVGVKAGYTVPLYATLTFVGTQGRTNLIFSVFICSPIISAICWSNPLSSMERTMTVTSSPIPARKPAHSNET